MIFTVSLSAMTLSSVASGIPPLPGAGTAEHAGPNGLPVAGAAVLEDPSSGRGAPPSSRTSANCSSWSPAATSHYRPDKGDATAWALTMAHRRAIDRVRSAQASRDREQRAGAPGPDYDQVAEQAGTRLEHQEVHRCPRGLTDTQRESIALAYYGGYTYREVAELLGVGLAAVKTRMRDGLIRLRDCLGVQP
ncbi:sigma-70 family RNA polymerase sigma factor [Spirillospora sp. NPDC047418]